MSKVTFTPYYLVNKHTTNLMLKAGYISIRVGGFAKVLESDLEHPDVADAVNRGWIEVHSKEPDPADLVKPVAPVVEFEGYRGMTADELKASEPAEAKSKATSEAIGRPSEDAPKTEATVSAIGQSAEEANGVVEVEKAKRARKTAE